MKSRRSFLICAAVVFPLGVGCEPRPIAEQPPAEPSAMEQPATDVDANPDATLTTPNEKTGVGVDGEVGGGQGVQGVQGDATETPAQQ